jgi:hypothetical protein
MLRDPLWVIPALALVLAVFDLARAENLGWWDWVRAPAFLLLLWSGMNVAFERLTISAEGVLLRGPLLRRWYSWKAVEGVQRRGDGKVILDLGHRRSRTFEFSVKNGGPPADHVAGVVERLRGDSTSALTSYRVSLSWGAAVFLPAAAAVVAATAWALFKG